MNNLTLTAESFRQLLTANSKEEHLKKEKQRYCNDFQKLRFYPLNSLRNQYRMEVLYKRNTVFSWVGSSKTRNTCNINLPVIQSPKRKVIGNFSGQISYAQRKFKQLHAVVRNIIKREEDYPPVSSLSKSFFRLKISNKPTNIAKEAESIIKLLLSLIFTSFYFLKSKNLLPSFSLLYRDFSRKSNGLNFKYYNPKSGGNNHQGFFWKRDSNTLVRWGQLFKKSTSKLYDLLKIQVYYIWTPMYPIQNLENYQINIGCWKDIKENLRTWVDSSSQTLIADSHGNCVRLDYRESNYYYNTARIYNQSNNGLIEHKLDSENYSTSQNMNSQTSSSDDKTKFKLAFEYYRLSLQTCLSQTDEENMSSILELAQYDWELDKCIIAVDDLLPDDDEMLPYEIFDQDDDKSFLKFQELLCQYLHS